MSLLPSGTFASLLNPYYGSGGGGSVVSSITSTVSTLISPTLLSTVGGTSILNYAGTTTSIVSQNSNGVFSMIASNTVGPSPVLGFIGYNAALNLTGIGDGQSNVLGGVVVSRQELLVTDPRGPGNSLALTPINATNSLITQGTASNGVVAIGSSQAQVSTIRIYDTGATAGVLEVGGNGGIPMRLAGGSLASNACIVRPDVANGGKLSIGSSAAIPRQIEVTDASGVYFGSPLPPIWASGTAITALAGGTYGAGSYTMSLAGAGFTDGMYLGLVSPFPPTGPTDVATLPCAFSFNFYVKGNLCVAGGVSSNTSGNVFIQPASGLASIVLTNASASNIFVSVIFTKVTGALPGF